MPCAMAGLTVYLATYRLMRWLSLPVPSSSGSGPRCAFILSAVCQVRVTSSPMRPIAYETEGEGGGEGEGEGEGDELADAARCL